MKMLKRILLLIGALLVLCVLVSAADYTATTPQELYSILFQNLKTQTETFSVDYTGDPNALPPREKGSFVPFLARDMTANLPNTDGTGPDIHMLNIYAADFTNTGTLYNFNIQYLLDAQQLSWVDTQVDQIAETLQLAGLTDYMKIKKIYQYMGTNFTYDLTLTKFTDYDGLTTGSMVCQGYALLTYKLMWEAGIPCRLIVGRSSNENHGWNIVKLGDRWYCLDTTWDSRSEDSPMYWDYFLKSEADFVDHTKDAAFDCDYFRHRHPMSAKSYAVPSVEILIDGVLYSSLTIRNGRSIQLQAALTPNADIPIQWSSSDEDVVSISEDGTISSLTPGNVYITATAEDSSYTPGVFPVTAVDLRTSSDWAIDELTSYYLRKLYPADLCSDYQQPITREEAAYLLYLLTGTYGPKGGTYHFPGFQDVQESPYWYSIVYTASRGIFDGTGNETFSPTAPVTREQFAKMLYSTTHFMQIKLPYNEPIIFADEALISNWAKDYIDRISGIALMQGDGENFNPQEPISREEAAIILERLFVNYIEPAMQASEAA